MGRSAAKQQREQRLQKQQQQQQPRPSADQQDAFHRMNFLLHAARIYTARGDAVCRSKKGATAPPSTAAEQPSAAMEQDTAAQPSSSSSSSSTTEKSKGSTLAPLGRFYGVGLRKVAAKMVLRLDPNVKHSLCRRCNSTLVPGVTSRTRTGGRSSKRIITTCLECGFARRHPRGRDGHVPFTENPKFAKLIEHQLVDQRRQQPNSARPNASLPMNPANSSNPSISSISSNSSNSSNQASSSQAVA